MKKRILFVCLGNICRSPAAEAVFGRMVAEAGLTEEIEVDSAGLIDYHEGELADPRMRRHAAARGYELLHRSRPVVAADFFRFDWIVGMDRQNMERLARMSPDSKHKMLKLSDFCVKHSVSSIPDPYYGGDADFAYVIDLLENACAELLRYICDGERHGAIRNRKLDC